MRTDTEAEAEAEAGRQAGRQARRRRQASGKEGRGKTRGKTGTHLVPFDQSYVKRLSAKVRTGGRDLNLVPLPAFRMRQRHQKSARQQKQQATASRGH